MGCLFIVIAGFSFPRKLLAEDEGAEARRGTCSEPKGRI
jgi:hypothetical protein